MENLVLLCRFHRRVVHEEGYQVERDAEGSLLFRTPRGWSIPEIPPMPPLPRDPMRALVATNRANGHAIDAWTGCPAWYGERLDLGWAIGVLHPVANPPRR